MENRDRYSELESWYTGSALESKRKDGAEDFPVKFNPIRTAAQKHISALFGEFAVGDDAPHVHFHVKPTLENDTERSKTA